MRTTLFMVVLAVSAAASEPSIIFDSRPESGVPVDAMTQKPLDTRNHGSLGQLAGDSIKTVRVMYHDKATWTNEQQIQTYIAGLLTNVHAETYSFQVWSQGLGRPELECGIEFTSAHQARVRADRIRAHDGRLLIWKTEACFRDATGRWWFVALFDHYHGTHPAGNRSLARTKAGP